MLTLREIAHALGGDVAGGQVLCPGPGHSARDRSVAVRLNPGSPGGVLVWSHGGSTWQEAKDHVLGGLGLGREPRSAALKARHGGARKGDADQVRPSSHLKGRSSDLAAKQSDDVERRRRAVALWHAAGDAAGTVVERYLAGRALELPEAGADVLRYHGACAFGAERLPTMVAALRCVRTDRLQAVHRTAMTADGRKVGRKMLGPVGGAAVKLDADDVVTIALTVGEGIETCLAARVLGMRPAWALGSVGAIRVLPVLAGIETLTILVETDDGGASEAAARVCAERWHAAGREVILARPRAPGDMNDALRKARAHG